MSLNNGNRERSLENLRSGKTPENDELLREITVGLDSLTDFISSKYLKNYIPAGGSKIKFVTGNPGSGKTHFAIWMQNEAERNGFLTVFLSAKDFWLHDFREVYLQIIKQCDVSHILEGCAKTVVERMGHDPNAIPAGKKYVDLLSEMGENDAITRNALRQVLREMFVRNPLLDNTFAACCSMLTGDLLGHPILESSGREILLGWLNGDKSIKPSQMRSLGINPAPVTKYNARHLLRSLSEVIHLGGYQGLMVVIDDLEALLNRSGSEGLRYSKNRREDTYESIRQLIDDIDSMHYVMFLFCFDRELMDDESLGMKSYQALWLRIQNEVVSTRFNRFADIIDMDRYGDEMYTPEVLRLMSQKLSSAFPAPEYEYLPLTTVETEDIRKRAVFGRLGLPYLMNRMMLEGAREDV